MPKLTSEPLTTIAINQSTQTELDLSNAQADAKKPTIVSNSQMKAFTLPDHKTTATVAFQASISTDVNTDH